MTDSRTFAGFHLSKRDNRIAEVECKHCGETSAIRCNTLDHREMPYSTYTCPSCQKKEDQELHQAITNLNKRKR